MIDIIIRKLFDPLKAFEVDREISEIKNVLQRIPIYFGKGTPEGNIKANVGSLYLNILGGTGLTLYVKETGGQTSTGWVAK